MFGYRTYYWLCNQKLVRGGNSLNFFGVPGVRPPKLSDICSFMKINTFALETRQQSNKNQYDIYIFRLKKNIISAYKSRNKLKIAIFLEISNLYSHSRI